MKLIQNTLSTLKVLFWLALAAAVITGVFYADFHIWRLVHPQAPTWTYLFSS